MKIANFKLQIAKVKILHFTFYILPFAFLLLSGCVSYQVLGEIQKGRMELMYGDPKAALAHFQRAAELDPNYVTNFTLLKQGVWTYAGRANYASGNMPEARRALERARSTHQHDDLAKLYLGLVLARQGQREKGVGEIEGGLRGLGNWLDYIDQYTLDGPYWDPARHIRREVQRELALIASAKVDWEDLTKGAEWLGLELEKEIDLSKRDRMREEREGDNDSDGNPD